MCPDGFEVVGGKAKVKDANAKCVQLAVSSCPMKAIISSEEKAPAKGDETNPNSTPRRGLGYGVGRGHRYGRGMGYGRRRGGSR